MPAAPISTDILIVGAGPTGLFGAFCAGLRGLRVAIVDSLPEAGGQVTAMYPEKQILDIAGLPGVKGRDLVTALMTQAEVARPVFLLGRTATGLHVDAEGVRMTLDDGGVIVAGAIVITGGIGKFTPRPLPAGAGWQGRGLEFFVPDFEPYRGRRVVVVGGGDSACDWATHLDQIAEAVTLVHRRDTFRAHERTVQELESSGVEMLTGAQVTQIWGGDRVEAVEILQGDQIHLRSADAVIAALGFTADLTALQGWGLEMRQTRQVLVDSAMRTNLSRVFAAGDIAEYPGKVRLIAVGFGEVATAVNNAAVLVDPRLQVFPGHSTELAALGVAEGTRLSA